MIFMTIVSEKIVTDSIELTHLSLACHNYLMGPPKKVWGRAKNYNADEHIGGPRFPQFFLRRNPHSQSYIFNP